MNADAVAALREALHDRHLDSEANGCDHHADEYGESLQCRDEAEALLAHPSFAALAAAPLPSESHYECWFCKGQFVEDALIAGYDTFDEQRLACLACNERMQGNWRPHAAPLPSEPVWLIERGQPEGLVEPQWWGVTDSRTGAYGWVDSAFSADQFATRDEAAAVIARHNSRPGHPFNARAVEHAFIRENVAVAAPLPSDTPARIDSIERYARHDPEVEWPSDKYENPETAICAALDDVRERRVHNHGPDEGRGTSCPESLVGACILPSDTPADGLDAAWREAEAALPEGWRGPVVRRSRDFPDQYWALAEQEHGDRFREGYAATPTMALRALAFALAALTQEPRSTREEADPA